MAAMSLTPGNVVGKLAVQNESQNQLSESQFLGGFVNPDYASRGPNDSNDPTIIATFKSRTALNIFTNSNGAKWPLTTNPPFFVNGSNSLGICITPFFLLDSQNQATGVITYDAAPFSGFTFDPDNRVPSDELFATNTAAPLLRPWPLSRFNSTFPGASGVFSSLNGEQSIRVETYRIIGLRATISVEQSAFTAAGTVIGGDFETYHNLNSGQLSTVAPTTDNVIEIGQNYNDPIWRTVIGDGSRDVRLSEIGAYTHGQVYEACWLPTNDDAREFKESVFHLTNNTANQQSWPHGNNMAALIANQGALVFLLKDLAVNAAVVVNVTMACEITVRVSGSPIGFLMNQARFQRRYVVDWSIFATVRNTGILGTSTRYWKQTPQGMIALQQQCGMCSVADLRVPVKQAIGAISPEMGTSVTDIGSFRGGASSTPLQYTPPPPPPKFTTLTDAVRLSNMMTLGQDFVQDSNGDIRPAVNASEGGLAQVVVGGVKDYANIGTESLARAGGFVRMPLNGSTRQYYVAVDGNLKPINPNATIAY